MGAPDDIFPLPLSDFEFYSLRDETPEYPMVMILRLHLDGAVDEFAFRQALKSTLTDNPLLRSIVREHANGPHWHTLESPPLPLQIVQFAEDDPPDECRPEHIDIRKEPGVRFELRRGPERSVLVCHLHHAK